MNSVKKLTIVAVLYFWSVTAQAVPITTDVGNVTILGSNYLLSILYDSEGNPRNQSYDALMPSITFNTEADAAAAAEAIDSAFPNMNWNPKKPANSPNGTRVVYALLVEDMIKKYSVMSVIKSRNPSSPVGPANIARGIQSSFSFAQFTFVNAVPEPSIIALFAAGLIGLGFARRKVRS